MIVPTAEPAPGPIEPVVANRWAAGWAVATVVTVAMLAPTFRRGYVLRLDMVFVPRPPLSAHSLGLDGSVPRAVPMDFLVALLSHGLPADVVQKLMLATAPVLGVLGLWRLLREAGVVGQVAGALMFSWNAYVYERLLLGHWSLLLGVSVLPWVLAAALDRRAGRPRALIRLWLWLGLACVATPTTGVLALVVATAALVPTGGGRAMAVRLRDLGATGAAAVLFAAPWWIPGLLAVTRGPADPGGVTAFAARGDTPLGPWGSLLTFGGAWDAGVVPPGRDSWPVALAALAVLCVATCGVAPLALRWGREAVLGLSAAGVASVLVAGAATTPAGAALLRALVVHVGAFGLLRDGQKLVAPWALVVSVCFGFGVARAWHSARLAKAAGTVAVLLAVLPLVALPGLAWGAWGRLEPVTYPVDYVAVQRLLIEEDVTADVLVLPWHLYRAWSWNGRNVALDPFQRLLERTTVVRDDLEVGQQVVAGEDPRVPAVTTALAADEALEPTLRQLGIGVVVVDLDTAGGPVPGKALAGLRQIYAGRDLAVYAVGAPLRSAPARDVPIIIGADVLAAGAWLIGAVSLTLGGARPLLQFRRREEGTKW